MIEVVSPNRLRVRRLCFLAANLLTYAALLALFAHAIAWNGWSGLKLILFAAFAIFVPWNVLGLWNAAVGLTLLFAPGRRQPAPPDPPITLRTAVVMTIRNEDPERAVARLRTVQRSIDATGRGACFGFFLLSDTSDPEIAAREEAAMAAWQACVPSPDRLHYRRRADNVGFKAGNVMDFCQHWAEAFELMLTLDADSLMSGAAVLQLVRIMQAHPRFGIVQGLVTGLPSSSPFARMFQFGMRHGMRSYTVGQAWWTGDCGPFWGHNAVIRTAPFRDFCRLPKLSGSPPFGGHILSHDQVEATLMRRGGFDVRLQPVAGGSWEDNPPTLLDYVRRDLRWCQGNLQYIRLLAMPGLRPVSRFQLFWAILMFISIPAGTLLIALLPLAAWELRGMPEQSTAWLNVLYWLYFLMYLSPKLSGYLHTAASRRRRARYGGLPRYAAGVVCELVFSLLQYAITSLHVTGFITAMLRGNAASWSGQARDTRTVSWREATRAFWPHTLFGVALYGALGAVAPSLIPWAAPLTLGSLLAIPFAVVTANPGFGHWCARHGLCAVPEERMPPAELTTLASDASSWPIAVVAGHLDT
jgi:membrane glycosyltransferase